MRNLQALILAAGLGTRMKPFSFIESKTMVNFLGKPLLAYHIDEFIKNNIKEFVVVCNNSNINIIKTYFTNNYPHQYHFDYIVAEQLGTAYAVYSSRNCLKGSFIVKYGDSISEERQIAKLLSTYNNNQDVDGVVTLRETDNPKEYGIAKFDKEKNLIGIVEKPKENPPSNYALVGLFLLKAVSIFPFIEKMGFQETIPSPEFILRNKGTVSYWFTKGKHIDLGRPWNILEATKFFIDKLGGKIESSNISPTATISKKSYIGKNAIIQEKVEVGDYCHIDSFIGRGTKIEKSYIFHNTNIKECSIIKNSVIGISDNKELAIYIEDYGTEK